MIKIEEKANCCGCSACVQRCPKQRLARGYKRGSLSYIFLKYGGGPVMSFILNIILLLVGHSLFSMRTIRHQIPSFSIRNFIKKSIFPSLLVLSATSVMLITLSYLNIDSKYLFPEILFDIMLVYNMHIALNKEECKDIIKIISKN